MDRSDESVRDDACGRTRGLPNTLSFSQAQLNAVLGNSLASLYRDLLEAPLPDYLKTLLNQLEEKHPSGDEGLSSKPHVSL